jgi:hypothetical protein
MIRANSSPVRGPGETQFGGYVRGRDPPAWESVHKGESASARASMAAWRESRTRTRMTRRGWIPTSATLSSVSTGCVQDDPT